MTKKRSINILILLSIILVVGLLASFVSFTYPFSINGNYYRYSCFVNELVLGADISDGVVISYRATLPKNSSEDYYDDYMNNTIIGLKDILTNAGYKDSSVSRMGDDEIQVIVGDVNSHSKQQDVISLIGSPEKLTFSSDSTFNEDSENNILGRYVKTVKVKEQSNGQRSFWYVDIQLDSEGTNLLEELTSTIVSSNGSLYMYLGDQVISSNSLSEPISDGHITMFSEENFVDQKTTQAYANKIKTGLLDLDLTQLESSVISASMGNRITVLLSIGLILLLVASFIFLIVRYKQLGLLCCFNLLFFAVIGLGLLQSIPFMHINFSGIFAMAMCYVLAFDGLISICEKSKSEYAKGKKLHTCFKLAQKKCLWRILIPSALVFVAGIVCALMPVATVQSFGLVSLVLSLVGIFTSLVMFRLLLKLYSALNFYKGEKCNFKLEEAKNVK